MMSKTFLCLQERVKLWAKPATSVLFIGILSNLTCGDNNLGLDRRYMSSEINRGFVLKKPDNGTQDASLFLTDYELIVCLFKCFL